MKLPDPTELDHPYGGEPYRVYFESQLREALAQQEAVMRMALKVLHETGHHSPSEAIKALEEQLK